jgi:hypothetical protein
MVRYFIRGTRFIKIPTSILLCSHTPSVRWSYEPTSSSDLRLRRIGR